MLFACDCPESHSLLEMRLPAPVKMFKSQEKVTMTPGRESPVQTLGPQPPESELLAEVEFFRTELGFVLPPELRNARYSSLINHMKISALNIEKALHGSDRSAAPRSQFEAKRKEELLEWAQLHFSKLRALKDTLTSLIDSRMADLKAPERGTHRKAH
jgi:hypothetical protein